MRSSQQAKSYYKQNWKICERSLIANATHCQQPVDQHVGSFIQDYVANKYWHFGESLLDEIDVGKRLESDKVGIREMRKHICEWTDQAIVAANKQSNLLRHAWTNFGLYLPLDGSKDGDIDTIVD